MSAVNDLGWILAILALVTVSICLGYLIGIAH
jgi:hypothetical protein